MRRSKNRTRACPTRVSVALLEVLIDVFNCLRIISLRQAHASIYRRVVDARSARPSIAALATPGGIIDPFESMRRRLRRSANVARDDRRRQSVIIDDCLMRSRSSDVTPRLDAPTGSGSFEIRSYERCPMRLSPESRSQTKKIPWSVVISWRHGAQNDAVQVLALA